MFKESNQRAVLFVNKFIELFTVEQIQSSESRDRFENVPLLGAENSFSCIFLKIHRFLAAFGTGNESYG